MSRRFARRLLTFMVLVLPAVAGAQAPARVVSARGPLTVRSCAETACAVVAELPPAQAVGVLETRGSWHRVIVTLEGARATAGWVEASAVVPAPRPATPVREARDAASGQPVLPESMRSGRTGIVPPAITESDAPCLVCVATRTPTSSEWQAAIAAASTIKAPLPPAPASKEPEPAQPVSGAPTGGALPAAPSAAPADTLSRLETVQRDGRTTEERMRADVEARFGDQLKTLAETTKEIDLELQSYMSSCYARYLPVTVVTPGAAPVAPVRPRASVFDLWRGNPVYRWTETWSRQALVSAESTAYCQAVWNRVNERAATVKQALDTIDRSARDGDVYPGVIRDVFEAHGLAEKP